MEDGLQSKVTKTNIKLIIKLYQHKKVGKVAKIL